MKRKKPSAFDVDLDEGERKQLASDLCRDIDDAINARAPVIADGGLIDLADWFYEQGRSDPQDRPFPGAADLTSYFITMDVDALRARLMKAIWGVKPFCFVEGWGQDAAKAPFVEAFHDWQVRKGGLRLELAKTLHGALLEDGYILEVSEKIETRRLTDTLEAALELNEQGGPVFAEQDGVLQPKLRMDEYGDPVPAQPNEPSAKVERTHTKTKRLGPQYDAISLKDFVFLPGHAKNQKQVWGYASRFYTRLPELQEKVADGIYDKDAVEKIGQQSDREQATVPVTVANVQPQYGDAIEKELFQVSLRRDLDGDGREEWYVATVSTQYRELLRLKLDTFVMKVGRPRCVPFILFPRRESVYGYCYAADKLLTLAEEHTALRNMKADRSALATNAPMTVLQGALWDPDTQPIGVGRTIIVRSHDEVKPMLIPDVPNSVVEQEMGLHQAAERVSGLSDTFIGLLSAQKRTLGENRLAAGGSAVRVDEVMGHLHAAIADVMALSHAIWVDTLEAEPKGLEAPTSVIQNLQTSGSELQDGRFTVLQLKGDFLFEPYGSDSNADPDRRRADFNSGLEALTNLAKVFPGLQIIFQSPDVTKWVLEEWAREYDVRDRQALFGALNAPPLPPAMGPGLASPMGQPPGVPVPGGPVGPAGALPMAPAGGPPGLAALLAMVKPQGEIGGPVVPEA